MVKVFYNNINIASGLGPTPLVSRSEAMVSYGERNHILETFTIKGKITGACESFEDRIDKQRTLLSRFNKDFQPFEITEEEVAIASFENAIIRNVSFPSSNYAFGLDYEVTLDCIPENFFSGYYGVLDPSEEFSFEENDDKSIAITHSLSARGFNTSNGSSNALYNARNFCYSRSGYNNLVVPAFLTGMSAITPCLREQSENINRFDGTYKLTETYVYDPMNPNNGLIRHTSDVVSGFEKGVTSVSIKGSVEGCIDAELADLRTIYTGFDIVAAAQEAYYNAVGNTGLNVNYLSSGIGENGLNKTINFDVSFDDDQRALTYFEYQTDVNTDYLTEISTIQFRGTIRGRGPIKSRWNNVQAYYTGLDVYSYINNAYTGYELGYPLNPKPRSSGVTFDSYNAEISISAELNNKTAPPSGLETFDYSFQIKPPINKYVSKPLNAIYAGNSGYAVFDLDFINRETFSINGKAEISKNLTVTSGLNIIKNEVATLTGSYLTGQNVILENYKLSTGNIGASRTVDFSLTWSEAAGEYVIE